jgi:UDP:flavonoid glycosyltransferase YjiC (YdhE family)
VRPLILVSYSTSFQNQVPTLQRVAEAVAPLPVRVLMTLGHRIAADELRLPPNVVAEPFVPHAAVLGQTRLVVTHAGHGTVMAAVTAGVPMLARRWAGINTPSAGASSTWGWAAWRR